MGEGRGERGRRRGGVAMDDGVLRMVFTWQGWGIRVSA